MSMIVDTMKPIDDIDRGGKATALLSVRGMVKHFGSNSGLLGRTKTVVRAVDGIDFDVLKGETLGIVGESGCGKSTLGRLILRLIDPSGGVIRLKDDDITTMRPARMSATNSVLPSALNTVAPSCGPPS